MLPNTSSSLSRLLTGVLASCLACNALMALENHGPAKALGSCGLWSISASYAARTGP